MSSSLAELWLFYFGTEPLYPQRLGLRAEDSNDESVLFKPLLNLLEEQSLDFHSTFRTLCFFKPSFLDNVLAAPSYKGTQTPVLQAFIARLLEPSGTPERLDHGAATGAWLEWLEHYVQRIKHEAGEWTGVEDVDAAREVAMCEANPRFVLRQWVLEEVIKRVEQDSDSGKRVLAKVMHVRIFTLFFRWVG